jgi:hypothetical protein
MAMQKRARRRESLVLRTSSDRLDPGPDCRIDPAIDNSLAVEAGDPAPR